MNTVLLSKWISPILLILLLTANFLSAQNKTKKQPPKSKIEFSEQEKQKFQDFKNLLQLVKGKKEINEKITIYLKAIDILKELNKIDKAKNYATQIKKINNIIHSFPPPQSYITDEGVVMVLVSNRKKNYCYISTTAINRKQYQQFLLERNKIIKVTKQDENKPITSIRWKDAVAYCQWLSKRKGFSYSLPSAKHLKMCNIDYKAAIWTVTNWRGYRDEMDGVLICFGVKMYTIYDKKHLLQNKDWFGELDNAHYPNLGFAIEAPLYNGIAHRINSLKKTK